jgi:outer membrane immunogenic protein
MKRIVIALLAGVAAVASLGYTASAADLRVAPAPAPAPVANWNGFYIGFHGGAAWQSTPGWNFLDPNFAAFGGTLSVISDGGTALGGVGGVQGGYNWQFAPAWVAGIEGDFSWASLSDHRTSGPIVAVLVNPASTVQMSANTEWLSSVRGKLGFVGLWNTMFYATGGVAWAKTEYAGQATIPAGSGGAPNTFVAANSFNRTNTGWVAGAGAEWMATTNILLRAEYLYYNFNGGTSAEGVYGPPNAATARPVNFAWNSDNYNVQVFRVAASYKF